MAAQRDSMAPDRCQCIMRRPADSTIGITDRKHCLELSGLAYHRQEVSMPWRATQAAQQRARG